MSAPAPAPKPAAAPRPTGPLAKLFAGSKLKIVLGKLGIDFYEFVHWYDYKRSEQMNLDV